MASVKKKNPRLRLSSHSGAFFYIVFFRMVTLAECSLERDRYYLVSPFMIMFEGFFLDPMFWILCAAFFQGADFFWLLCGSPKNFICDLSSS